MEQERVWTRMGRWFRRARLPDAADLPPVGRDGFLQGVDPDNDGGRAAEPGAGRLSKQQLREQALEKLQDGHLKIVSLVESIQKHMEVQERHGEATTAALKGIAGNMTRLSEAADRQTETLTGIAGQLQSGNDQTRRWAEFFAELPALAEAQRGTLATLSEQVAAGRQAEAKIGESLESVHGAFETLGRSQTTSTQALLRLEESSGQNQKLVGELIRKQRAWLARLVVVTLCVALAAVALAVIALVR